MSPATPAERHAPSPPDPATLRRALKSLQKILKRHPEDLRSMVRVARAHRLLGEPKRALRWYRVAVHELSHRGQGLRALALAKEMLAVAPDDHELLLEMARLYAKNPGAGGAGRIAVPLAEAPREGTVVGRIPREFTATSVKALQVLDDPAEVERIQAAKSAKAPPPPPPEAYAEDDAALEVVEEQLHTGDRARPASAEHARAALEGARLGEVPLLGSLGQGAFMTLATGMTRLTLEDGDLLFEEGAGARSFFIVAEGELEAITGRGGRDSLLAVLGEGQVAGVLGLYSGRRRNATVRARAPSVVFEVTHHALAEVMKDHPASKKAIGAFYRQRLLETFLGTTAGFRDLDRATRLELTHRFRQHRHPARQPVVSVGEVTNGVWLVVKGEVAITGRSGGQTQVRARLGRGQVFGCISALTGIPTNASAECTEETVLATLSHKSFTELVKAEQVLRSLPARLGEAGFLVASTFFVGDTPRR